MSEMASFIVTLVKGVGTTVFFGLSGSYLVVAAIVGRFVPRESSVGSVVQRKLLGGLGIVLAAPTIVLLYLQMFTGRTPATFSPEIPERVAEQAGSTSELQDLLTPSEQLVQNSAEVPQIDASAATNSLVFLAAAGFPSALSNYQVPQEGKEECTPVESFGLDQGNIRRLKHSHFQESVYVYVGDIHYNKPFDLHVVVANKDSWPSAGEISEAKFRRQIKAIRNTKVLSVQKAGDFVEFTHAGRNYKLTVTTIYAVLIGTDKLAIEICERP